jgi:hypothetical protein
MKNGALAKKKKAARRIDFIGDRVDHTLLTYIGLGYSTQFIEARTGLAPWQISYRAMKLRRLGISRSDYRNGSGLVARIVQREAERQIDAALIRHLEAHL